MSTTAATRTYKPALDRLMQAGLRPTRQRLGLAKLLFDGCDRHVTAEQLHGEALAADLPVSLATVYNTLNQFTGAGLLREVVVEAGRSYFDTNVGSHHHFFVEGSGHLQDIPAETIQVSGLPDAPAGTRITRVDIIIRLAEDKDCAQGDADQGDTAERVTITRDAALEA